MGELWREFKRVEVANIRNFNLFSAGTETSAIVITCASTIKKNICCYL